MPSILPGPDARYGWALKWCRAEERVYSDDPKTNSDLELLNKIGEDSRFVHYWANSLNMRPGWCMTGEAQSKADGKWYMFVVRDDGQIWEI